MRRQPREFSAALLRSMRSFLRFPVFQNFEVFRLEIRDVIAFRVRDHGVDLDKIDGNTDYRIGGWKG